MHKKNYLICYSSKIFFLLGILFTVALLVVFAFCGINHALAKGNLTTIKSNQTDTKSNLLKACPLHDKVLLCVESGFDSLLTDDNKKVLDQAGSFSPLETLIELSSGKEVIQKVSYCDSSNEISSLAKDSKWTTESNAKCKIVSLSVDNADAFIDKANQLDCVVWAEKDFVLEHQEYSNPQGDIEIEVDDGKNFNDKDDYTDEKLNLDDLVTSNTGKASNFKKVNDQEEHSRDTDVPTLSKPSSERPILEESAPSFNPKQWPNYTTYFNDLFSAEQWQYYEPGYGINAKKVWDDKGELPPLQNNNPVVAVVDTGVAYDHPDLVNSMWTDGLSIPSLQALGGGKYGANYSTIGCQTDDPYDDVGHGTHCASLIAAENNNNVGGSSLNGTNVKIMALKSLASAGTADLEGFIKAYNYILEAKKQNVNIVCISNSWGIGLDSLYSLSWIFNNLVFEAYKAGMVSCFAAGNSSLNMDVYPNASHLNEAGYFTVGASTDTGKPAFFSNYGNRYVDVFSPGVQTLSAVSPQTAKNDCRQFLPWLDAQPEDIFYYKDFNNDDLTDQPGIFNGVNFYAYLNNDLIKDDVFFKTDGRVALGLDKNTVKPGDKIGLMLSIKRNDLIKMSEESEYPWLCFTYSLDDTLKINEEEKISINYIMYEDDGSYIYPLPFKQEEGYGSVRNTTRPINEINEHVLSVELNSSKFINNRLDETYDDECTVDILLDFYIENISDNSCLCIDNFGFGKNPSKYHYMSGTSMACPITSSLIASLASRYNKSLDNPESVDVILDCIKGGVKHSNALKGVCVSEGVIDAYNSLIALKSIMTNDKSTSNLVQPSINSFDFPDSEINNFKVAIKGNFFGENPGKVLCDGNELVIESWNNEGINVAIDPKNFDFSVIHEIKVERPDGREGKEFLEVPESDSVGYESLSTSGIVYYDSNGRAYTTDSLIPASCTSTPNNFYVYYSGEEADSKYPGVLECYNYKSNTWKTINTNSLSMIESTSDNFFMHIAISDAVVSLAAGENELYMLYVKKEPNYLVESYKYPIFSLATYSEEKGEFIYDVDIPYSRLGDRIFTYNGELYLYGKDQIDFALDIEYRPLNMFKVYPDNGKYYDGVRFSDFETSGDGVTCYQDDIWLASSLCTSYESFIKNKGLPINPSSDKLLDSLYIPPTKLDLENKTFEFYSTELYTNPVLSDPTQNISIGAGIAVDKGVIYIGQVVNNGSPFMQDTYLLNKESNSYSVLNPSGFKAGRPSSSSVRLSNFKPRAVTAAAHDNKLYVCLASGTKYENEFKVLDLKKYDLLSQEDSYLKNVDLAANHPLNYTESSKDWSDKNVTYELINNNFRNSDLDVVDGTEFSDANNISNINNAQTGDLKLVFIAALLVLFIIAFGVFVRKNKDKYSFTVSLDKVLFNKISYVIGTLLVALMLLLISINYAFAENNSTTGYVNEEGQVIINDYSLDDFTADINQFYVSSFNITWMDSSAVDFSKVNLEITYKDYVIFNQKCNTVNTDRFFSYKWNNEKEKLKLKLSGLTKQELSDLGNFQILLNIKYREFDDFMFNKLDDYSMDQLKIVADNISEFDSGSKWYQCMKNFAENGDIKLLIMENSFDAYDYYYIEQKLYFRIVGINHDDCSNCPGKKAGLTFMSAVSTEKSEPFIQGVQLDKLNQVNWGNSTLMQDLQKDGDFYNLMPVAFKENVEPVDKLYHTGQNILHEDEFIGIKSISNYMFVPSVSELKISKDTGIVAPDEGEIYEYIKNDSFINICSQWDRPDDSAPIMHNLQYILFEYLTGRYIAEEGKRGLDYLNDECSMNDVYTQSCYDLGIYRCRFCHTRTLFGAEDPDQGISPDTIFYDHYGHFSARPYINQAHTFNPMFCL